jgi:hypothetical protein
MHVEPLKNLEASRNSPMALPIGVAIPTVVGKQVWFQIGGGVMRSFPLDPLPGDSQIAPPARQSSARRSRLVLNATRSPPLTPADGPEPVGRGAGYFYRYSL